MVRPEPVPGGPRPVMRGRTARRAADGWKLGRKSCRGGPSNKRRRTGLGAGHGGSSEGRRVQPMDRQRRDLSAGVGGAGGTPIVGSPRVPSA